MSDQTGSFMGESFWQNKSLVTHILFELQPIMMFSPVANSGHLSLGIQENLIYQNYQYFSYHFFQRFSNVS